MKKKLMIICPIVIFIICGVIGFTHIQEYTLIGRNIVLEKSYTDSNHGYYTYGSAILDDGRIIKWDYKSETTNSDIEKDREKFIFSICEISNEKLSEENLETIKALINKSNKDAEIYENNSTIGVLQTIAYSDDEKAHILSSDGDFVCRNSTDEAKQLIEIASKNLSVEIK